MQRIPSCLAAAFVLVLACGKGATPDTTPGSTPPGDAVLTPETANCANAYDVVGAVRSGVLTESINGQSFTDTAPFECVLLAATQQVVFSFNDSSTDPTSGCKYTLTYTVDGSPMSSPQTLNCPNPALAFTTTATPDSGDPKCDGKPTIVLDPKIVLKTNNCGGDEDE